MLLSKIAGSDFAESDCLARVMTLQSAENRPSNGPSRRSGHALLRERCVFFVSGAAWSAILLDSAAAVWQDVAMRMPAELALLIVIGVFLGVIGPYGTATEPALARYAFWVFVTVAGGMIGLGLEALLRRWISRSLLRLVATAVAMTPPITLLVLLAMIVALGHHHDIPADMSSGLVVQVFVISLFVMGLRMLARRERRIVEMVMVAPLSPPAR
jgi:hypothetical protein